MNNCREKELWLTHEIVVGFDEAGRGPWAGPLAAAAVAFPRHLTGVPAGLAAAINDSKKLTATTREALFTDIAQHALAWEVLFFSSEMIDQMGIGVANQQIMIQLYHKLLAKLGKIDWVVCDYIGRMAFPQPNFSIHKKGDSEFLSIAAASIIAKVSRDRLMTRYDEQYPHYAFAKHKGYGTKIHLEALKEHGPCPIHRRSFSPVKDL